MDPFVQMLIQALMNGTDGSFFNSGFDGSDAFARANNPFFATNPFPFFGQFPGQNAAMQPQARNVQVFNRPQQPPRTLTGTTNGGGLRPMNNPAGTTQPMNQPNIGRSPVQQEYNPMLQNPIMPVAQQPTFQPTIQPNFAPVPPQVYEPILQPNPIGGGMQRFNPQEFLVNLAGFNVPINMTGITNPYQSTLPGRGTQPTQYLPPVPRGIGPMSR